MTLFDRSPYYDILLILDQQCLLYHFSKRKKSSEYLGTESFLTVEEAIEGLPESRELYVVTSGEHFYEDEVTFEFFLKDEKVLRALIDEQIDKNPSINEKVVYHYHAYEGEGHERHSRYYVFGYSAKNYTLLESQFERFTNMQLLTSNRQILYNFSRGCIPDKEPFIAVYRLFDLEIMAVSNGSDLIFSRVHRFGTKEPQADLLRSINYVIHRFKDVTFTIYLGGMFTAFETLASNLMTATEHQVKALPQSDLYPNIVDGVMNLPQNYNFVPLKVKAKRRFQRVIEGAWMLMVALAFVSGVSLLWSYNEYKDAREDYNGLQKRYEVLVEHFSHQDKTLLERLERIARLKNASNDKGIYTLINALAPLSVMNLRTLSWEKKSVDDFTVVFEKGFDTLSQFYTFEKVLDRFEEAFRKEYPLSKLIKSYDLSRLQIIVSIEQKRAKKQRSRLGGRHD